MSTYHNTKEYRIFRALVIRRDKICQICKNRKNRQVHHMNSASYFKKERYNVKNGVCLCKGCHTQFHTNFKKSFREKCTEYDFRNFEELSKYLLSRRSEEH